MFGSNTTKRTGETPMDFKWETGLGPVDSKSPWLQHSGQQQKSFGSPSKPISSFISSSSTAATAFRNPAFTTPRKPFDPDLFSEASGVDSSPGDIADAEDTPEIPKTSNKTMTAFTSGASERKPIFGRYGASFAGNSPGSRIDHRKRAIGQPIAKKRKRQQRDDEYGVVMRRHRRQNSSSESDSESGESRPNSRSKGKGKKSNNGPGWFANLMSGIESRPNLPNILSYYAQLALNSFLVFLTIFGVWTFWTTVRADVDKASEAVRNTVIAEIAACAKDFTDNRCGSDRRLPALEAVCQNWEMCMNRDPNSVGRARVSAKTFAQILDSFIEEISYKAMIFIALVLTLSILINNLAFGMFRSKTHHAPQSYIQPPTPYPSAFQFPSTPGHHLGYEGWPNGMNTGGRSLFGVNNNNERELDFKSIEQKNRSPSKKGREPSRGRIGRSPSKGDQYRLE